MHLLLRLSVVLAFALRLPAQDPAAPPVRETIFHHLAGDWKRQSSYKPTVEQLARMALYGWKHDPEFRHAIAGTMPTLRLADPFRSCPVPVLIAEKRWDLTWNTDKPQKLQACFPGSQLVMFEQSGHAPFDDEAPKFFAALENCVRVLRPIPAPELAAWKSALVIRRISPSISSGRA